MTAAIEVAELDRQIQRAQTTLARMSFDAEAERDPDPFHGVREIAGQTTFKSIEALEPSDHRAALLRWVHEMLQIRVGWDLIGDEADAVHAVDPTLSRVAPSTVPRTYHEAFQALIEAPLETPAGTAFDRLTDLAPPVAAVRRELRARRFEVARRLGLDHPWALVTPDRKKLEEAATKVLDTTEAIAMDLAKRRKRGPVHAIYEAYGRDAREGWPAHLGTRWFEDLFRAIAPRPPKEVPLPAPLGAASFLRGAFAWGGALRATSVSRSLPFALARDPSPNEACAFGGVFALALADRVFARRRLDLSPSAAAHHARVLDRVLLFTLRAMAAQVLLFRDEQVGADLIEELSARVFGAPLPKMLGATWAAGGIASVSAGGLFRTPLTSLPPVDLPARLLGLLSAHGRIRTLVDRFDEDWFANPRAGTHLASMAVGPIHSGDVPDDASSSASQMGRHYEERLG